MTVGLRGLGDPLTVRSLYSGTVPITCPTGFQVQPITAFVNNPDEPAYLAASNWKCSSQTDMNVQAGRTYGSGLKLWASGEWGMIPWAIANAVMMIPTAPGFALGVLTPPLLVLGLLMLGGKKK
jgi:hypothetical protein